MNVFLKVLSLLVFLKTRLSRVSSTSWHYRLVVEQLGERRVSRHACIYRHGQVPVAILMWSVKTTCMIVVVFLVLIIVVPIGWILGFTPNIGIIGKPATPAMEARMRYELFYPYMTDTYGRRRRFAPYYFLGPVAALMGLYIWAQADPQGMLHALQIAGILIGICFSMVFAIYLWITIAQSNRWQQWQRLLGRRFEQICPPLIVDGRQIGKTQEVLRIEND